jgi:putative membrane protein
MMFPGWGMGGWMMASYRFVLLLILVGIVVALVALSRRAGRSGGAATPTATELLAQRYAGGEIDDDEYFQRLSVLDSTRERTARPMELDSQPVWPLPGCVGFSLSLDSECLSHCRGTWAAKAVLLDHLFGDPGPSGRTGDASVMEPAP